MSSRGRRAACLALAAGALACEPGDWIWGATRRFEELDAAEGVRRVDRDADTRLVQVRPADSRDRRIEGAEILSPDGALDAAAAPRPHASIVVATDDATALRFAARLVRAGFGRVAAVRGGVDAWIRSRESASASGSDAAREGRARAAERR